MRESANGIITIITSEDEVLHVHSEVELLYVLEGKVDITIRDKNFYAKAGDIILFNSEEMHGWVARNHPLLCKIYISYYSLKKAQNLQQIVFDCNSSKNSNMDFSRIRSVLDSILNAYISEKGEFQIKSLYYSLWEFLCKRYLDKRQTEVKKEDRTIEEIILYLNQHYKESISQAEIAEKWFMSQSAFSRYFKSKTRQGFTEYIRKLRIEYAKLELEQGNSSITEIGMESGFSTIAVFNRNFKDETGISPSAYRMQYREKIKTESEDNGLNQLTEYLKKKKSQQKLHSKVLNSKLNMDQYQLLEEDGVMGISGLFLADLKKGKVQEHLRIVTEQVPLEYVLMCNPLDDTLERHRDYPVGQLDFESIDSVLDFLMDINIKPYFELPRRKRKIIEHIGSEIFTDKVELEFVSLEEWKFIFEAFMQHILERYSLKQVQNWKFGIWKDAEEIGNEKKYLELYKVTYQSIRKYIPKAQIGACCLTVENRKGLLTKILNFWKENNIIPDFHAIISYPYGVEMQENGSYVLHNLRSDTHFLKKDIEEYKNLLRDLNLPESQIVVTEWNTSLSQKNYYNDSCAKACHMLMQMIDMSRAGVSHFYSNLSDCTIQLYESKSPLTGTNGLLTKDGLYKPAYFILEFWIKMGRRYLGSGENYYATAQSDGSCQILAYNAKKFNENYFVKEESQIYIQELNCIFNDQDKVIQRFELTNLENKKYCIRMYMMRESEGTILTEWGKLGNVENLIREEISYLNKISVPRMRVKWENVIDNKLNLEVSLEPNEIALIIIR